MKYMKRRYIYLLAFVLVVALLIRLPGISKAVQDDESIWAHLSENYNSIGFSTGGNNHPPLAEMPYMLSVAIFGFDMWSLRIVPLFFGMLTLILVFLICRMRYNLKTAFFAIGIMSISFYHVLNSLMLADQAFILFLYTAGFYFLLKYELTKEKKWYVLVCVTFALGMFTKFTLIYLLAILGLYFIFNQKTIKEAITVRNIIDATKKTLPIAIAGVLGFLMFPLLSWLSHSDKYWKASSHASQWVIPQFQWLPFAMFAFWATPLLIGLALMALNNKDRRDVPFFIWILVVLIAPSIFINRGDFSRYLMPTIVPMSIVGANFLSRIKFSKKNIITLIVSLVLFLSILNYINMGPLRYDVPRLEGPYIQELINFKFDFIFSYVTSSGPMFGVSMGAILLALSIGLLLVLASIFAFRNKWASRKQVLILFLGVSIGFNVFLLQEYLFSINGVDVSNVKYQIVDYIGQDPEISHVYTNDEGIAYFLDPDRGDRFASYIGAYGEGMDKSIKVVHKSGGAFLRFDFPPIKRDSQLWLFPQRCKQVKDFSSKKIVIATLFNCDNLRIN